MDNTKRRSLLKALGVAPIIYTLPSGNVLANTSSTCNGDPDNTIHVTQQVIDPDAETLEYEIVDNSGTVYSPTSDYYTTPDGTIYYFDGNNSMLVGSCWTSITVNGNFPERW